LSRLRVWDGGAADVKWSTAANWVDDVAPVEGDDLIFPTKAARFIGDNNFIPGIVFSTITIEGGNYLFGGFITRVSTEINVLGGTHTFSHRMHVFAPVKFFAAAGSTLNFT